MSLRGETPLGPLQIGVRNDRPSLGQIEEQLNRTNGTLDVPPFADQGLADSFFDVWTEVSLGDQRLVTNDPIRIDTVIEHKPPMDGERYVNPFPVRVQLIDVATGAPQPLFLVQERG